MQRKPQTKKITVKYMRESDGGYGKSVRLRYAGGMYWFPKKVIVDWDDEQHYYYNEEFTCEVQVWFLTRLKGKA